MSAHRVAWEMIYGPIPDGICVCHYCNNPLCVNVAHLYLGTVARNNLDKVLFGNHYYKGEEVNTSRLTRDQVHTIRTALRQGQSRRTLAEQYGVSKVSIANIARGKTWAWLDD